MVVECVMQALKITQMILATAILVMVIIVVMTLILDINVIVHVPLEIDGMMAMLNIAVMIVLNM